MLRLFLPVAFVLSGCQILSGLSSYEATEPPPEPPLAAAPFGKSFGSAGFDGISGAGIAADGSIVIGGTMSQVDFGSGTPLITYGEYDPFLAKFDATGKHLVSDSFGTPDGEAVWDVAVAPDGRVAVVGLFDTSLSFGSVELLDTGPDATISAFVAVFDASLEAEWAVAFPGFNRLALLQVDFGPDGEVVVAGGLSGSVDFMGETIDSNSDQDAFVLGLSAGGAKRWLKHIPSTGSVVIAVDDTRGPTGLAVDGSGNSYVAIPHKSAMTFSTVTGTEDSFGDVALLKVDGDGLEQWVRIYGGLSAQIPTALTVDLADRPVLAGLFHGRYLIDDFSAMGSGATNVDLFVSRFSGDGTHLATTIFPGAPQGLERQSSLVVSLVAASDGSFVGAGSLFDQLMIGDTTLKNTSSTPNLDALVFRLDAGLKPTLAKRYGDIALDIARWAGRHPSGHLVVSGEFDGQLRFDDYDFVNHGESDIYLVQYDP